MIPASNITLPFNTLRKDGFFPYLLSRSFAGETESNRRNVVEPSKRVCEVRIGGEQAVIYQQPDTV
jgi:hypothetical protein